MQACCFPQRIHGVLVAVITLLLARGYISSRSLIIRSQKKGTSHFKSINEHGSEKILRKQRVKGSCNETPVLRSYNTKVLDGISDFNFDYIWELNWD